METMQGKVAVVTGASAGIGRATALSFGREGVNVVVADVDLERGEQTAADVIQSGVDALFVHTDVSDASSVANLLRSTVDRFGRLDFAFNNAGIEGTPAPTADCPIENWNRTIASAVVWLCSEGSAFVTGHALAVDGGFVAR